MAWPRPVEPRACGDRLDEGAVRAAEDG